MNDKEPIHSRDSKGQVPEEMRYQKNLPKVENGRAGSVVIKCNFDHETVGYLVAQPQNEGALILGNYLKRKGGIEFNNLSPFIISKADKSKITLCTDANIYLSSKTTQFVQNGGKILVVPQSYRDKYEWIDCFHINSSDGVDLSQPSESARIHKDKIYRYFLKKIGWFGVERNLLLDFLNSTEDIKPEDLLTFEVPYYNHLSNGKPAWKISLGSYEGKVSVSALFSPGSDTVRIVPRFDNTRSHTWINGYIKDADGVERLIFSKRIFYGGKKLYDWRKDDYVLSQTSLNQDNVELLQNLTRLFGSSSVIDILYTIRPDFNGIPVDQVRGILSEYLGDFLLQRRPLTIPDIEAGVGYLGNPDFAQALYEVMKDDCLEFLLKFRKENPNLSTWEAVESYFSSLVSNTSNLNSQDLDSVINRVVSYYESVVTIPRPLRFVESLKKGRDFPDIYQQVNIQEIEEKRRMLIADRMGLGKSGSALMSKELLGIKQALVVVPSNVISTWLAYLSDGPEGYYKSGLAPSVLVIESPDDLTGDLSHYEYIIVSQEKLNDRYAHSLLNLDYKMLIVDEIHKLKNLSEGIRASHIVDLAYKIESDDNYLVLISGTPVPNKIHDVAISLKLLYPDRFKDVDDKDLVNSIISGDIVNLRSLLIPRMQRKTSLEGIDLPDLHEKLVYTELSDYEREIYQILLEEDEITATDKLRVLRQFVLNPNALGLVPESVNSKARYLGYLLSEDFKTKNRISVFVNGYVNGVIRGDKTIFDELNLPENVQLRIIDGKNSEQRDAIQNEFNTATYPILLVISGQTADVGRDFSGGQANYFFNEPWTEYDRQQQLHRIYREGLQDNLVSRTMITQGTIEEGIHWYIQAKYKAVEKLLNGIPISDLEKKLLSKSEDQPEGGLEINPELAEYYFSTWDRMMKFFTYAREMGEEDFKKFLNKYGDEYAQNYVELENRSYYANTNRVVGTLINAFVEDTHQTPESVKIVDLASGPEVLRKHLPDNYQNSVTSIDINQSHFKDSAQTKRVAGSFLSLPFKEGTFEYATLSLAWHYSSFLLSRQNYERLQVLLEAGRVLKTGGKLIISNIYSLNLRDENAFATVAAALGFRIIPDYTGEISGGNHFNARMYTLEKVRNPDNSSIDEIVASLDRDTLYGVKFKKVAAKIKDSRKMINRFLLNGNLFSINLNQHDQRLYQEEQQIYSEAEELKKMYGKFESIPAEVILENDFGRIRIGKHYRLFKRLPSSSGIVVVK